MKQLWYEGDLVRTDSEGHIYSTGKTFLNIRKLPKDFCLELVEL